MDTLTALLEGGGFLAFHQLRALRRHLESGCPSCNAFLAAEGQDREAFVRMLATQEAVSAPAETESAPPGDAQEAFWNDFTARLAAPPEEHPSEARSRKQARNEDSKNVASAGKRPTVLKGPSLLFRLRKLAAVVGGLSAAAMIWLYVRPTQAPPQSALPEPVLRVGNAADPSLGRANDFPPGAGPLRITLDGEAGTWGYLFVIDEGHSTRLWPEAPEKTRILPDGPAGHGTAAVTFQRRRSDQAVEIVAAVSDTELDPDVVIEDWRDGRNDRAVFTTYDLAPTHVLAPAP
jgi:hypothetical protein